MRSDLIDTWWLGASRCRWPPTGPRRDQTVGAQVVLTGASRSTSLCFTSCMTAIAVNGFVTDAIRKGRVLGVMAPRFDSFDS